MYPINRIMKKLLVLFLAASTTALSFSNPINVYFGTSGGESKGIYHSTFDTENGELSKATLAAEIRSPGFLATNSNKTHLYAVGRYSEPVVVAYKMDADGSLSILNTTPIGDGGAAHISVHPSGKFLLTAQYGTGSVAVFPIAEDGSLKDRSQLLKHEGGSNVDPSRQGKPHPHWGGFSPDGQYAFVPDLGLDQIVIYKVDIEKATLAPHGYAQALPGSGPRHMRFSIDGKFIYLLNELTLSVTTFEYDSSNGTVKRLTTTASLSEETKAKEAFNSASEILVHPNGEFVYSANRGHDSVSAYRADPQTGQLTVTEVENIRGSWPRNINLDPTSQWLLAAGAHSNTVSVFAIDQNNGELTFQTRKIINVPGPICIVFSK